MEVFLSKIIIEFVCVDLAIAAVSEPTNMALVIFGVSLVAVGTVGSYR